VGFFDFNFLRRNVFDIFESDRPFLRYHQDGRSGDWNYVSYLQAKAKIEVLEQGLRDVGFLSVVLFFFFFLVMGFQGDIVAIAGPNIPSWVFFDFACLKQNFVVSQIYNYWSATQFQNFCYRYEVKRLIVSKDLLEKVN